MTIKKTHLFSSLHSLERDQISKLKMEFALLLLCLIHGKKAGMQTWTRHNHLLNVPSTLFGLISGVPCGTVHPSKISPNGRLTTISSYFALSLSFLSAFLSCLLTLRTKLRILTWDPQRPTSPSPPPVLMPGVPSTRPLSCMDHPTCVRTALRRKPRSVCTVRRGRDRLKAVTGWTPPPPRKSDSDSKIWI